MITLSQQIKTEVRKMKIRDIIKNDYLTLSQLKSIPKLITEWLTFDDEYTFDAMLNDQTKMFANNCTEAYAAEVIKIEKVEWVRNWQGRKNDYNSDITVWVTAIVDLGNDKIVRLSYDLLDSLIMTTETGCSGSVR